MATRKEQLFAARKRAAGSDIVPPTVAFKLNRKKGAFHPLSATDKMKCALRKVLADMSDESEAKCRYYIDGNLRLTRRPVTTPVRDGEPQSYRAAGICKVGICHPQGHKSSMIIQFDISYRDTRDEHGQADVAYVDPTTIDQLPNNTPINTSML